MRRQQYCEAYEGMGAKLHHAVLLPEPLDGLYRGCWTIFGMPFQDEADAETLRLHALANNSPRIVDEFRLDQAIVALIYVYPNGQACAGLITLEDAP
jgi:hypothetical protein